MIDYKEIKTITDAQLRPLYEAIGWHSYTGKIKDLQTLLTNCQLVYSAWDGDKLVGLVRTVGDGISIQYVQDILVLPNYQKYGIGSALMEYVLEKSRDIRQLVLITDCSEENKYVLDWYEKQGLVHFENASIQGFCRFLKD